MVEKKVSSKDARSALVQQSLLNFFSSRLDFGNEVCVAFSGGCDSVVLLHALNELCHRGDLAVSLSALHVHHGISSNANAWTAFCEEFCSVHTIPLAVHRVCVANNSGKGLEAAARNARYAVFKECRAHWLALAHHQDDQVETVLLNLLRGAGIVGVAGMPAERTLSLRLRLVRPLLDMPRELIKEYAYRHHLQWVDDESNLDSRYRRNFLRNEIIPKLAEHFPKAQGALARAARHFAEGAKLLDELAIIDHKALASPAGRVLLAGFNALDPAKARNLLRFIWQDAGFQMSEARWIEEAMRQLAATKNDSETCVATADGELHVYRGEIYLRSHRPAPVKAISWQGEEFLPWADGKVYFKSVKGQGLNLGQLQKYGATLQPRQGGEQLHLHPKRPRKSLRNLFKETAIPPWERERLPFLWCGKKLAWVGRIGMDVSFACSPTDDGILPVWEG